MKSKIFTGFKSIDGEQIFKGDMLEAYDEYGGQVLGPVILSNGKYLIDLGPNVVCHLKHWAKFAKIVKK